ncbi:MAG: divalent-cation tolerance protein CutA [Lysobacterales bacterium]
MLCSCPCEHARPIAEGLVEQRLAACVKVLNPSLSIYRWDNQVESAEECVLLIKTVSEHWNALQTWMSDHHPYDIPELITLPVESTTEGYLQWIMQSTTQSVGH